MTDRERWPRLRVVGPFAMFLVVALVAVGLVTTAAWFASTDATEVLAAHGWRAALAALVTFGLTSVNLVLRWLRWGFLLRRHHVRMPTRDTFRLFFMTLPAVLTPLYLGELVRVAVVSRSAPRAGPAVFWTWIVERSSDAGALLLLWGLATQRWALVAAGVVALCVAPWWLARRTLRNPEHRRLHTGQVAQATIVLVCAGLSSCAWLLPAVSAWAILALLTAVVDPALAMAAFAEGTVIGALSLVPGGTAITGSTTILSLTEAGIGPAEATATVAILRLGTTWYAASLGALLLVLWRRDLVRLLRPADVQVHFDALADSYADELSEDVRKRLLERKIAAMTRALPESTSAAPVRGLDLGCGQGWYAADLALAGFQMTGIDTSEGQIRHARRHCESLGAQVDLHLGDGKGLPFPDATFDFAYSINVLHHVTTPEAQVATLQELVRVLKPGGAFFLHEMNIENPVFRLYMSYLFPLLKSIDEGTELWIRPTHLPSVPGAEWAVERTYFTFLPDFLPGGLLRRLAPLEQWLERSRWQHYSAHYMVVLRRRA